MKTIKDYSFQVPLWMRDDDNFMVFWEGVFQIFEDIQKARKDITEALKFDRISENTDLLNKIASYFGINRNFYLSKGTKVTGFSGNIPILSYDVPINIVMTNDILFRIIKFKILQSNFDGTLKNLLSNYSSIFSNEEDIIIQFFEDTHEISGGGLLPMLNMNMVVTENLTKEEATLFLNGAYQFNLLGTIVKTSLGGKTIELWWDDGKWDESKWKILEG